MRPAAFGSPGKGVAFDRSMLSASQSRFGSPGRRGFGTESQTDT